MKKNKKIFVLLCLLLLLSRSTVFAQNQSITNTGGNAALTLRVVKARSYMVEVPAKLSVTQADAVNAESTPPTIEFKVSGKNIILPDPINMNLAVRVSGSYPKDETATLQSGFKVAKIGGTRTRLVDYKVFDQDKKEVAANGVLAQFTGYSKPGELGYDVPQTAAGSLKFGEIRYGGTYTGNLIFTVETINKTTTP